MNASCLKIEVVLRILSIAAFVISMSEPLPAQSVVTTNHQFGGPGSVGASFPEAGKLKDGVAEADSLNAMSAPLFDFQAALKQSLGLGLGFDYNALSQNANRSLGENRAAGGVVRVFGRRVLLGNDSGDTGTLVFKVENRHRLGTDLSPQELGTA